MSCYYITFFIIICGIFLMNFLEILLNQGILLDKHISKLKNRWDKLECGGDKLKNSYSKMV